MNIYRTAQKPEMHLQKLDEKIIFGGAFLMSKYNYRKKWKRC